MQCHFNLYTVFPVSKVLSGHGPEPVNDTQSSKKMLQGETACSRVLNQLFLISAETSIVTISL